MTKLKNMTTAVIALLFTINMWTLTAAAATQQSAANDSMSADSMVTVLQTQLQEMKMKEIMLQDALLRSNRSQREDSMRMERRKQRIDSLRQTTKGSPLVIDEDTLLLIYASRGGMSPQQRTADAREKVMKAGKTLLAKVDSIYIFESEGSSDIMCGDVVLISVSDIDALWSSTQRQQLAREWRSVIEEKVNELHEEYGLRAKVKGVLLAVIVIAIQVLLIILLNRLMRRLRKKIALAMRDKIKPLIIKNYELLTVRRGAVILIVCANILHAFAILTMLTISVPLTFASFPETEHLTRKLFGYIWDPLSDILMGIIGYVPNLIKMIIIIVCFHYLLKGIKWLANEVGSGRLAIDGFYPDWAGPTYQICRVLIYCFAFVMIWPLLPNSDSEIFKGVSMFVGLVFSLGSTTVIGNIVSGIVITYMRPFKIGDYIKVNDTEGTVVEKTAFVTRLRTPKRDVVTVPNSSIMSTQIVNYSKAQEQQGYIVHTEVTIGYSVNRSTVIGLLTDAAHSCHLLEKSPEPFVLIRGLEDFYIRYQINAFTNNTHILGNVYSELHNKIVEKFNAAGVEIMSPHYIAKRSGEDTEIPKEGL